jgi:hypothetical protein
MADQDGIAKTGLKRGTSGKNIIPRERLDLAEKLYLTGKSGPHIVKKLRAEFGVAPRTARRYIALVEKRLAALPKPPPEATFQRVQGMLLETYKLARGGVQRIVVSGGKGAPSAVEEYPQANVGTMATVAWRLAELHGITVQRVEVSAGGEDLSALTDEEFNTLRALKAKARAAAAGAGTSAGALSSGASKGLPG